MTPQEKHALLQFMGTAYGDAHKQDQMIVGQSGQLKPNAHELKQQFEQIAATPAYQQQKRASAGSCTGAGCYASTSTRGSFRTSSTSEYRASG